MYLVVIEDNRMWAGKLALRFVSSSSEDRDIQKVDPISLSCVVPKW